MSPNNPSPLLSGLSTWLIVVGILICFIGIPIVRRAFHARIHSVRSYFYHNSELTPTPEPKETEVVQTTRPTALEQIAPPGWDYSIYNTEDHSEKS
jgi:hypothetical protein